jgi:hypothetical protein
MNFDIFQLFFLSTHRNIKVMMIFIYTFLNATLNFAFYIDYLNFVRKIFTTSILIILKPIMILYCTFLKKNVQYNVFSVTKGIFDVKHS